MLNEAIRFVLDAIFSLLVLAALVRFWMQAFGAPARNPLAQFTMALTDFMVKPLRRVIPGFFKLDIASLVTAWAFEFLLQFLLVLLVGGGVAVLSPAVFSVLLFLSLVKLVRLSIYVFMGALLIQVILSWVNPYHPVGPFFQALTRPFTKPFQKAIPPIGGVDITPMLVLIAFQLILMLPVAFLEQETARLLARAFL